MKIKKMSVVCFLLMLLVLSGCDKSEAKGKKVEKKQTAVEVMKVEAKTITEDYHSVGKIYASEEVKVSSKKSGKVKKIYFDVGDVVKKGDVLYTLDNEDLVIDVELKKSQYKKALENAKMNYEDALNNFNKAKALYESGVLSKNAYDNAEKSYRQNKLNYEQAQKDLDSNSITLDASISDTIIKSPIDGVIAERNIEVGENTTASDFVIVNTDKVIVRTSVSEDIVNKISIGDTVQTNIQSNNYMGKIKTISPVGINNGNIYPVEIEIENKDGLLKPGMFAEVKFEIERRENQVVVPTKSILSSGNENYVYIVEENKPKKVIIEKKIIKDGYVQVEGELSVGDLLIVKGQEYIDEKSLIYVVNEVTLNE
ncbi:efflux RND transporter periplasmic adaptor subunit [Crassaminicella thermophila]|uniref:Efflux RND transporter periplasmic adaptor subunit n=1 Tax=Crassaminicella thermophila TaxID=2599308 RepID=A0A5C0SBE7_CRATE|nr:efflux RND transporter periplasmic adaptor subunit [Crassaminicella thermophila]QEK11237.1 efflux RND transporter periplasmic adaptor subunit [Crassaminicella thermophila]